MCASGSAHQFVGSQEQKECERLIIASGTDWAPAEEEFSTSPQAPPDQMVLLRAAALCVWPGSQRSQCLPNICAPLCNCCSSSGGPERGGTEGLCAQLDMGHPTAELGGSALGRCLQGHCGSVRQRGALRRDSRHR